MLYSLRHGNDCHVLWSDGECIHRPHSLANTASQSYETADPITIRHEEKETKKIEGAIYNTRTRT